MKTGVIKYSYQMHKMYRQVQVTESNYYGRSSECQ